MRFLQKRNCIIMNRGELMKSSRIIFRKVVAGGLVVVSIVTMALGVSSIYLTGNTEKEVAVETAHVPDVNFKAELSTKTLADKEKMVSSLQQYYDTANKIDVNSIIEDESVLYVTVTVDGIDNFVQYYIQEDTWGNT